MRCRLLVVLLTFSAFAVTAFAWPLLISTASERTQRFVNSRTEDLARFAAIAQQAAMDDVDTGLMAEVRNYHELYRDDGVIVVYTNGRPTVQAGISMADPGVENAVNGALRNRPFTLLGELWPWSDDLELFASPIGTDTSVIGAVVVRSSARRAIADITEQWTRILLAALAAAIACVGLAVLLSRWVLRPLAELEHGVLAVTEGRRDTHIRERFGPRELRALASSFNRMSEVVAESAAQQRRLIADASHELRSPIARLRLPVDSLACHITAEGQEAYRRIVAEIDVLESLSSSLLGLANADQTAMELAAGTDATEGCDVTELLVERREAWLPTATKAGVALDGPDSTVAIRLACRETVLKQVLDVTLDNAIKYAGAGARVRMACAKDLGCGRVAIIDDGPGLRPQELGEATTRFWRSRRHRTETGSGLGLAIAERLITAWSGTLRVRANHPRGLIVEFTLPLAKEVPE